MREARSLLPRLLPFAATVALAIVPRAGGVAHRGALPLLRLRGGETAGLLCLQILTLDGKNWAHFLMILFSLGAEEGGGWESLI